MLPKSFFTYFFGLTLGILLSCEPKPFVGKMPTDPTHIRSDEDENHSKARKNWFDLVHGGNKNDWKTIEAQNNWDKYQANLLSPIQNRGADEWVAEGNVYGRWIERGSNNNAGNIEAVDFDSEEDIFYAVGAGGSIFKGDFTGYNWQVVNDKLRFNTDFIKVIKLENNTKRIISGLNGIVHYSDDGGITWVSSTGFLETSSGSALYDLQVTKSGSLVVLAKRSGGGTMRCYVSHDKGKTFSTLKIFNNSDTQNHAAAYDKVADVLYILERNNATQCSVFAYNDATKTLDTKATKQPLAFTDDFNINLAAVTYRDTVRFYSFNEKSEVYVSKDLGNVWSKLSTMPSQPWNVGIFASYSDPRKIYYGEVNSYRSLNVGRNWVKMSEWSDYYSNIYKFLHADIMVMDEFTTSSGTPFLVNCNHGGINVSYDYGINWENIGLFGLNVSQYYDVRTYPSDPYFVFAGSQDQGQQRGPIRDGETAELYQNISGDYGHIEFTGNGRSLWSVYPGGSIGFYAEPLTQSYPNASYEIRSKNETVWIPPIISGPNPALNEVIAAGGSTLETSNGSFLLRLKVKGNDVIATQMPFNFASGATGTISAIAIDPRDTMLWYVATTGGGFFNSSDAGKTFVKRKEFLSQSHYLYGSCVLPSIVNTGVVYLSGNGYANKPVYKSTDGGNSWVEMSEGLPRTTVFNIVANEDESLIYGATEAGPYVFITAKNKWFPLSGSMTPTQTYWSVEYVSATKTARFGTYGRGIWDFNFKELNTPTQEDQLIANSIAIYPNPTTDFIRFTNIEPHLIYDVLIYDFKGQLINKKSVFRDQSIDVSSFPAGNYIVKIRLPGNLTTSIKMVKG